MSKNDQPDGINIPNPLYYTGRIMKKLDGGIVAGITGMVAMSMLMPQFEDSFKLDIDTSTDTAQEEALLTEHQQDLAALKTQKLALDVAQSQHAYAVDQGTATQDDSDKLLQLEDAFEQQAHKELRDIYLQGVTDKGPTLGEDNFASLHETFMSIASEDIDFKAAGYQTEINPHALHEALDDLGTPKGQSTLAQHNDMQEINAYLYDERHAGEISGSLAGVGTAAVTMLLTLVLYILGENKLGSQPKRIPLGRRKKHISGNIKH